jgi:hypothetical protein
MAFLFILLVFQFSTLDAENSKESGLFDSKRIPGCPDLESFQRIHTFESLSSGQLNRISCLCGPGHGNIDMEEMNDHGMRGNPDKTASITCIYGSTFADLEHTLDLAKKANKTIDRVRIIPNIIDNFFRLY